MDLQNFHKTTAKKLADLIQYLKCPICLDIIENVRELPCKHVFCDNCIECYAEGKGKIVCPLCKKVIPKRIDLCRDAAFDSICSFTKKLFTELKEHKVDDSSLFGPAYALKEHENAKRVAFEEKTESQDCDVIPSTVKHKENKKPKKNNYITPQRRPLNIKSCEKKRKQLIKKVEVYNVDKKVQTPSNVPKKAHELKNQPNTIKKQQTIKKNVIQNPLPQFVDNKSRILQWLHDTKNIFERLSQTQKSVSEKDVLLDIDMPSVSQIAPKRSSKNCITKSNHENEKIHYKCRRAQSVEHLGKKECKSLKRHSLECSTPSHFKQYQNPNEIESIENQLIIHLMEDEVLDAIDKNASTEKCMSKKTLKTSEKDSDFKSMKFPENEFLDKLERNCDNGQIKTFEGDKRTKIDKEKNLKSPWRSISNFKKSIAKYKGPRKLNISLQSSQKHSKKNTQVEMTGTNKINYDVNKGKTVDFQKLEDYLSKVIPEMIKENIPSPTHEMSGEVVNQNDVEHSNTFPERCTNFQVESIHEKQDIETGMCSDKSESDIYICHTQPLSKDVTNCNKIECALKFAKKLEALLIGDNLKFAHSKNAICSIFQIIKNIYYYLNHNEEVNNVILTSSKISDPKIYTEKEIQTDIFSLDGFNITPTAVFKSLCYDNKETQTEFLCVTCPHNNENLQASKEQLSITSKTIYSRAEVKVLDSDNQLPSNSITLSNENSSIPNCIEGEQLNNNFKSGIVDQNKYPEHCILNEDNKKIPSQQYAMSDKLVDNTMEYEEILEKCDSKSSGINTEKIIFKTHISKNSTSENIKKKNSSESCNKSSVISNEKNIIDSSVSNVNESPIKRDIKVKYQSTNECFRSNSSMQTGDEENLHSKNSKIDLSPESVIIYSLASSKSKVNRKLMFEKAIKNREELRETLKRVHTDNSNLESEDTVSNKLICNKFLQNDLSIEFESETVRCSQYPDENFKVTQAVKSYDKKPYVSCADTSKEKPFTNFLATKTQNEVECTQTDALLNYCDELIAKANKQILSSDDNQFDREKLNKSSQNNSKPSTVTEKGSQKLEVMNNRHAETQEKCNSIKTQELLNHYDDLIAKANQHIIINEREKRTAGIVYGTSQTPTTSKFFSEFEKDFQHFDMENKIKSENSLGDCSISIKKSIGMLTQSQIDDAFFIQNLEQLDGVIQKANENKNKGMKNKYSESSFESHKDIKALQRSERGIEMKLLNEIAETNECENTDTFSRCTSKRRNSDRDNERHVKKIKILQNLKLDIDTKIKPEDKKGENFNSSEDEIFSDVDVVETTPQKAKHLNVLERLSSSQAVDHSTRGSVKKEDSDSTPGITIDVLPPPPGFEDEDENLLKQKPSNLHPMSPKESENIIPNSLSPERSELMLQKRSFKYSISNSKNVIDCPDVPKYFQQFSEMSPICEGKTNLNVIDVVHQSKFSPLTILPRATPAVSPLTSTPKQKSILNYITQNSKLTQNKTSESLSQDSNSSSSKPCIAFSRLDKTEVLAIRSLCSKGLASCQDKFGPKVTHMIVSTDKHNHVKDHTIKFLSAIAAGLWVLNFSWIEECLRQNKIVDGELYEVIDFSGVPSPRISRLSRLTNPLFKGFKFFIVGPFTHISVEDLEILIGLLSGVIVHSMKEFLNSENYICVILADELLIEDFEKYETWLDTYKVISVDISWLSFSVSRYKVLSFIPHLLVSVDSVYGLGYPQDLLVDVPSSCTQQNTCD